MKFIDFFAGIGGFRRGLELSGHKCVGFCEWDKFATASYTSMHLLTNEQRERLALLDIKKRQKEILKDEYRNGEWYANDIRNVDTRSLPDSGCWCFGAPCQDFSIAGKRAGLEGDRSSLVREIFRLLEERKEEDRPEWLIYENVKGMLSSNRGIDFLSILSEMDRLGYDIQWQNMHTEWYLPQHRERIYTVGHLRRYGRSEIFPIEGTDGENCLLQLIPGKQGQRVYDSYGISSTLSSQGGGQGAKTGLYAVRIIGTTHESRSDVSNIHDINGYSSTLLSRDYKGPKLVAIDPVIMTKNKVMECENICRCLNANDQRKVFGAKQERTMVSIKIKEATKKGYAIANEGDSINLSVPESKIRRGRVGKGVAQTLDTSCNQGIIVQVPSGYSIYAVWYEKYQCYIAIRRLTPKECFRLQGWSDDYFEKAAFVNSDSQLYKQAGNGVSVPVVKAIGDKIAEFERKERR